MKIKDMFDDKGNFSVFMFWLIVLGLAFSIIFISSPDDIEEMKYLEQGNSVEDFNIKTVLLWHGNDYPLRAEEHYTPDELNMMHELYIRNSNLTEEEFPIFDFANGTMPEFR